LFRTIKARSWLPEEKKILSGFRRRLAEVQRGYKGNDEGGGWWQNDEVARLLAEGNYLIEARKNTLAGGS